ncbi:MAG: hypothetical protein SWY16_16440 [Cyanobacteriota bacterium]|nr:hypothetical protein [Cyanobacteriota bacterium]
MNIVGLLLAVSLALVHICAGKIQYLNYLRRRWWISIAGGVSISYIFLDILPELGQAQEEVEQSVGFFVKYLEKHVYLLALIGLAVFYGLEKLALRSRNYRQKMHDRDFTRVGIFWVHILSFAIYNGILGYLFREAEERGTLECFLLFFALALHFIVNDIGLREHHKYIYDRLGRWILAGAIVFGWLVGQAVRVDEAAIAAIWAFTAGGIILNVLKEELPEEQESHFGLFAAGAAIYSVVLLAV